MTTPPRDDLGWLSRLAPGVVRSAVKKRATKDLWVKCPETGELCYRPDLEAALWVTPAGHHMRIGPEQRFAATFDDAVYDRLPEPKTPDDPLHFTYAKPYKPALAAARKATGAHDSMSGAVGRIDRVEAVVLVQNFAFIAGSLSMAAGETFVTAAEEALRRKASLVIFTAAAGARMQESALALMQMARATAAIQLLKAERLPYVVVLTDPTIGGVTASYAMLGDVQLAEQGAVIGFTGRRVIYDTIRETLPESYQTADFQVERGMADQVVPRRELPKVLGRVLRARMERGSLPDA
jgi:acetyl-CoA carboxylase carboxyl transferase subunit beta